MPGTVVGTGDRTVTNKIPVFLKLTFDWWRERMNKQANINISENKKCC